MNGREEYITIETTQRGGRLGRIGRPRNREAQRDNKDAPVWPRGVGAFSSSSEGSLLPGTLGRLIRCAFHPQNKPSPHQSPTFGPTLYKFIVMGLVRKPWPYNWRRLWENCFCDDECDSLLRQGQTPKGRRWWPICWAASGELPGGSQLNRRLTPYPWPSSLPGARRPANLMGSPL